MLKRLLSNFSYLQSWKNGYWVTWVIFKVIKHKFFSICWTEIWHKLEVPIFDSTFHSLGYTYPQLCSKSRGIPGIKNYISFKVCPVLNRINNMGSGEFLGVPAVRRVTVPERKQDSWAFFLKIKMWFW